MNHTNANAPSPSLAARYRWPVIITCMLLTHVGVMMLAVKIATGDTSNGVNGNRIDPAYGKAVEGPPRTAGPEGSGPRK